MTNKEALSEAFNALIEAGKDEERKSAEHADKAEKFYNHAKALLKLRDHD